MGVTAALVAALCLDHRRRTAPDNKKNVKAKRAQVESKSKIKTNQITVSKIVKYPDMTNNEAILKLYNTEVEAADQLINSGEVEGGTQRLSNAMVAHANPWKLLQGLHKNLSKRAFHALLVNTEQATTLIHKSTSDNVQE